MLISETAAKNFLDLLCEEYGKKPKPRALHRFRLMNLA